LLFHVIEAKAVAGSQINKNDNDTLPSFKINFKVKTRRLIAPATLQGVKGLA